MLLLEGNNVNQNVCNTEVAGRGLTYSLPLFPIGAFHGVALVQQWSETTVFHSASCLLLPCRSALVASDYFSRSWLLMPSCRHAISHVDGVRHLAFQAGRTVSCHVFFRVQVSPTRLAASNCSSPARQTDLPRHFNIPYPNQPKISQLRASKSFQTCFVLPITSPRTLLQSMLASSSSSTSPQTTTLSPLTRYTP
jgi:hypothetical protein